MFVQKIFLQDTQVKLKPLCKNDIEKISTIACEENIWTYFTYKMSDKNAVMNYLNEAILEQNSGFRYTFIIQESNTNKLIGSTAFGNYSKKDQRIEIGWSWLRQEFQGSNINKRTKFLMLRFAFDSLHLERVEFKTDVLNQKARNALRKIGAVEEGVLRSHTLMPDGRRRDTIYYSILKKEWDSLKINIFSDYSDDLSDKSTLV